MKKAILTAVVWREENTYVSLCPELGVSSCGDNPDDAMAMLREAVELYLENAQKQGIWEDIRPAIESSNHFTAPMEVTVP